MKKIIAILAAVLLLSGCFGTRTEETQVDTKNQNTEKVKDINETYDVNFTVGPYPVTGTFTRTVKEQSSAVTKEEANSKKDAKTTLEMPPEFKALMGLLTKLAANFTVPGAGGVVAQAGESFLARLGNSLTSDTGLATVGTATTVFGTGAVMYRNRVRRKREELEKQKEYEADEMLRQIVAGLEKFIADPNVSDDCKKLLMAELSKSLDKPTKDWLLELGFKVA
jgi:hypothetical protein